MRVFVYWNLHRRCWSVKALEWEVKGRVVAHAASVLLQNCKGKVSAAGNARVRAEGRKNVHAGIVGDLVTLDPMSQELDPSPSIQLADHVIQGAELVTYNPYRDTSFVTVATVDGAEVRTQWRGSSLVLMSRTTNGSVAIPLVRASNSTFFDLTNVWE